VILTSRAPAKINLTLRVLGRRADGFHELESLCAFAGVHDLVSLDPSRPLGLTVDGPTAEATGPDSDNLIIRAARALAERVPGMKLGAFTLKKRLPVGAGVGGGSSDAATALRLLAELNGIPVSDPRVLEAAAATGSDIPVCLTPTARMFRGRGDEVGPPVPLPPLMSVLVNPGIHVATPAVFGALGLERGAPGPSRGAATALPEGTDLSGLIRYFDSDVNDLETPAQKVAPEIATVISAVRNAPACRFARMSGSGSTVFGLFENCRDASAAAKAIRGAHPEWWVKPTVLR
jgi:4-diphosphocytidyl-2-C-methyl-D-erythritol kinase